MINMSTMNTTVLAAWQAGRVTYRERLFVPLSWWLFGAGFAVTCGWIFLVATTSGIALVTTAFVGVGVAVLLFGYGRVEVLIEGGQIRAGDAHIERRYCGEPEVLDAEEFRAIMGPRANARAYTVTRPYVKTGVLVPLTDRRDPTPYWLIASRRPGALAAALGQTEGEPIDREGIRGEEG